MAIDIDGFAVLKAIASKPDLFPDVKSDVVKAARSLTTKQLKASSITLDRTRRMFDLLKAEQFSGVLDGLKESEIKSLARKIDKNNTEISQASADKNRKLLLSLASGSVLPQDKAPPKPKSVKQAKAPTKKKVTRAISSEAMAARWDGTNPDDPKR